MYSNPVDSCNTDSPAEQYKCTSEPQIVRDLRARRYELQTEIRNREESLGLVNALLRAFGD